MGSDSPPPTSPCPRPLSPCSSGATTGMKDMAARAPSFPSRLLVQKRSLSRGNPYLRMKADCVPPSSSHARTTCAAISDVHLGCRAAANHAGSVFVVAVFVVIAPRTPRPLSLLHYLGWSGGSRRGVSHDRVCHAHPRAWPPLCHVCADRARCNEDRSDGPDARWHEADDGCLASESGAISRAAPGHPASHALRPRVSVPPVPPGVEPGGSERLHRRLPRRARAGRFRGDVPALLHRCRGWSGD